MPVKVPPPPSGGDITSNQWSQWFTTVRGALIGQGTISWGSIDFTSSNLTSIATRRHQDLTSLQGGTTGEYYHLTSSQHTGLTGGSTTGLHKHDIGTFTVGSSLVMDTTKYILVTIGGVDYKLALIV